MAGENEQIMNLLIPLHKRQQVLFGVICIKRVINLYNLFDEENDISKQDKSLSKGEAYDTLIKILDFIETKMEFSTEKEIKNIIRENINLIPDSDVFDLNAKVYIAQLIAQSVFNILRFSITNDISKISFCSDANLEIVNQIKTEQYYKDEIINTSITEKDFMNISFSEEIEIERKSIQLIKEDKKLDCIESFVSKNIIKW